MECSDQKRLRNWFRQKLRVQHPREFRLSGYSLFHMYEVDTRRLIRPWRCLGHLHRE